MSDINLNTLTTPDNFINHYHKKLKEYIPISDISLSKLDIIGFFQHILGNLQFDIKGYYDYLFKESFPITATVTQNLYFHSLLHRLNISFGTPATLIGNIDFNLATLPHLGLNIKTDEYIFENLQLDINGLIYTINSKYILKKRKNGIQNIYSIQIVSSSGNKQNYPITDINSNVPIQECLQYETDEIFFTVPVYAYGSYYIYELDIGEGYTLSDISIYIDDEEFSIEKNKNQTFENDNIVFIDIINSNIYNIYLGSGDKGRYVPNTTVSIQIKKTKGTKGNIFKQQSNNIINGDVYLNSYDDNDTLVLQSFGSVSISDIMMFNIETGINGSNISTGEVLRQNLIEHIQSRDVLVSETDYKNHIENKYTDTVTLFKKFNIYSNISYLYYSYKDELNVPIYSGSFNVLDKDFIANQKINYIYNPEIVINTKTFVVPFLFKYNDLLNVYLGYIVNDDIKFFSKKITNEKDDDTFTIEPYFFLQLFFDDITETTTIKIKSYENLTDFFNAKISISLYSIINENMIIGNDETEYSFFFDGILDTETEITISVLNKNNELLFTYQFIDVIQITNISDLLMLKKVYNDSDGEYYVANIPAIDADIYNSDKLKHSKNILSFINSLNLVTNGKQLNRIISDEIQMAFLNTYYVSSEYINKITTQEYNHDIVLPLTIKLILKIKKNYILLNKITITDFFFKIRLLISEKLLEKSGIKFSFYKSEIINIIQDFPEIKSVDVEVADSNGTIIENGEIEIISESDFSKKLPKYDFLLYTPIYWWWDINNIEIDYNVE